MANKTSLTLQVIGLLLIGVIVGIALQLYLPVNVQVNGGAVPEEGGSVFNSNFIPGLRTRATTTGTGAGAGACDGECPILLISPTEYDSYVFFQVTSDVDVYLFATSTALDITGTGADKAATTSLTVLDGILLDAQFDFYEVKPENFVSAFWYASTSAGLAAATINISYK